MLNRKNTHTPCRLWFLSIVLLLLSSLMTHASVVVSIKPLYGLVAKLTEGTSIPIVLLYDGARSPHTSDITPKQALSIKQASVFFWAGSIYEAFLDKVAPLSPHSVDLSKTHGIRWLQRRSLHNHHEHGGEQDHSDHHEAHGACTCNHASQSYDGHYFLHPLNACRLLEAMRDHLSQAFPTYAKHFDAQAQKGVQDIMRCYDVQRKRLRECHASTVHSIVFHDCMTYFDDAFGTHNTDVITVNPHNPPSIKQHMQIVEHLKHVDAILYEDTFPSGFVQKLIDQGTPAYPLDYLGLHVPLSPVTYEQIIQGLADVFVRIATKRDTAPK